MAERARRRARQADRASRDVPPPAPAPTEEAPASRARRRADFLRDIAEARQLRERVTPRRSRIQRERRAWWLRSYRR